MNYLLFLSFHFYTFIHHSTHSHKTILFNLDNFMHSHAVLVDLSGTWQATSIYGGEQTLRILQNLT